METQNPINPNYAKPALFPNNEAGPPPFIVTQSSPVLIVNPKMFKTTPVALNCLFCNKPMTTKVKKSFNIWSAIFCFFCFCLYACTQSYKGKDLCCFDTEHHCPHCGNVVGTYTAC